MVIDGEWLTTTATTEMDGDGWVADNWRRVKLWIDIGGWLLTIDSWWWVADDTATILEFWPWFFWIFWCIPKWSRRVIPVQPNSETNCGNPRIWLLTSAWPSKFTEQYTVYGTVCYHKEDQQEKQNKMKPTNPNAHTYDNEPRKHSYERRERECKVWRGQV